jgi:hypothetical protein
MMAACCEPEPESSASRRSKDLTTRHWAQSIWIANYVTLATGWVVASWRPYLWTAGLAAAGILCIVNAHRCGRLHCHVTGPLYVVGAVLTVLKANDLLPVSWTVLGVAILGGVAIAYAPEFVMGRYVRRRQRAVGATR